MGRSRNIVRTKIPGRAPYMTSKRFADLARELRGKFGWQSSLARQFQVHRSTVMRWSTGDIPIPIEVAQALEEEAARKVRTILDLAAG